MSWVLLLLLAVLLASSKCSEPGLVSRNGLLELQPDFVLYTGGAKTNLTVSSCSTLPESFEPTLKGYFEAHKSKIENIFKPNFARDLTAFAKDYKISVSSDDIKDVVKFVKSDVCRSVISGQRSFGDAKIALSPVALDVLNVFFAEKLKIPVAFGYRSVPGSNMLGVAVENRPLRQAVNVQYGLDPSTRVSEVGTNMILSGYYYGLSHEQTVDYVMARKEESKEKHYRALESQLFGEMHVFLTPKMWKAASKFFEEMGSFNSGCRSIAAIKVKLRKEIPALTKAFGAPVSLAFAEKLMMFSTGVNSPAFENDCVYGLQLPKKNCEGDRIVRVPHKAFESLDSIVSGNVGVQKCTPEQVAIARVVMLMDSENGGES